MDIVNQQNNLWTFQNIYFELDVPFHTNYILNFPIDKPSELKASWGFNV